MLNRLPYINVAFAILYFLLYLLNSWSYAILGVLLTIIFSFTVLSITEGKLKVNIYVYIIGSLTLLFAVFLSIWTINIFTAAVRHGYFADSWFYMLFSALFAFVIVWQFVLLNLKKPIA